MNVAGIVAEYNPFHKGHAWQAAEIRRRLGEDSTLVAVMSGNFVQRGDFAIMEKHARAAAALAGGVDLVLSLPTAASLSSAESFAKAAVDLLCATETVDTLCYGCETGENEALRRIALTLNDAAFPAVLTAELQKGVSFAVARQAALAQFLGEEAAALVEMPNNILAIAYESALLQAGNGLKSLALPRCGAAHDGAVAEGIASASYIREKLLSGETADSLIPWETSRIYTEEAAAGRAPVTAKSVERAILARLRSMEEKEFSLYDEGGEGLYHRFYASSRTACSVEELLFSVKTKRYALSRLRRMLLRMYLDLPNAPEIAYIQVLGANEKGCALLKEIKRRSTLPVLTKPAEARRFSGTAKELFLTECRCTDMYTLAYPSLRESGGDSEWINSPVIL